jgi:hypothetical protein
VKRYTADTNALLGYLADVLPDAADEAFARAERGTAVVEAPNVIFGEVFYRLRQGTNVSGIDLGLTPADGWRNLHLAGPVGVSAGSTAATAELVNTIDDLSLHDAMLVASHRAAGTDAVITRDPDLGEREDVATLWK